MNSTRATTLLRCSQCAARVGARTGTAQRRLFVASAILLKHGAVPSFTDVSSPELQTLFTTIREKIFLPAHLSDSQKLLIEKERYFKQLETENTTATIAGEQFRLKPLPIDQRPSARRSFADAMKLMKEKRDWDNLPNLLQGFKIVSKSFSGYRWHDVRTMVITRLNNAGRQDVLLECLRRASDTGLTMSERDLSTYIFLSFARKASDNDFSMQDTKKALSWAEQAVALMENPEHAGNTSLTGEHDPRISPEIIGVLLELAAVRASKHLDGKDEDNKVSSYAEKLLNTPLAFKSVPEEDGHALNHWLWTYVPVLHGMNIAQTVLGPGSKYAKGLKAKAAPLRDQVESCRVRLEEWKKTDTAKDMGGEAGKRKHEDPPFGLTIYEKLLGKASS